LRKFFILKIIGMKKKEEGTDEKYDKIVNNYKFVSVTDYKDILNETEEESVIKSSKLTKKEIEREISLLIGPVKEWVIKILI
jgi:hypothetical protein